MPKVAALYETLRGSPRRVMHFRDFVRILVAFGFACVRQTGSHRVFEHPAVPKPLIVQPRGKEAAPYQLQEFLDMVETSGLRLGE